MLRMTLENSLCESRVLGVLIFELKPKLEIFFMLFHMAKTEKFNMLRMMINMLRKIPKNLFWTSF